VFIFSYRDVVYIDVCADVTTDNFIHACIDMRVAAASPALPWLTGLQFHVGSAVVYGCVYRCGSGRVYRRVHRRLYCLR